MGAVGAGGAVGRPADPEGPGAVPVGIRGRIARWTSACTAARSASTTDGLLSSPPSPPPLPPLVVGAVVVFVVAVDVVDPPGSAIVQKMRRFCRLSAEAPS